MKKYKEDIKIFTLIIISNLFQGFIYYLAKFTPMTITLLNINIDKHIPFIPGFVYPYVLWHPLLIVLPYFIYKNDKNNFFKYLTINFITNIIAFIIFIIYPTLLIRPEFQIVDLKSLILYLVYASDTPALNCLPSIHCTTSFLFITNSVTCKNMDLKWKVIITITSATIILSTMFVKQHSILDAIASLIIITIVSIIVNRTKIWKKVKKYY